MLKQIIIKHLHILLTYGVAAVIAVALSACSSSQTAGSIWSVDNGKSSKVLTSQQQQLFNALYTASVNHRLQGRFDAEYMLLQQALTVHPNAPEALYALALLKQRHGGEMGTIREDGSDSLLHRAAQLAPGNAEYQRAYAWACAKQDNYTEAIRVYEKLVEKKPSEEYLTELFEFYRSAGQLEKALEALDRLERLEGTDNEIYFERYQLYIAMKDTTHAYAAIDDLIATNPGELHFPTLKANLYHEQGYNDKALALFNEVLKQDPKNTYCKVSLLSFYKTLREDALYNQLFDDLVFDPVTDAETRDNIMRPYFIEALRNKADTAEVMPVVRRLMDLPQENHNLGELCIGYMVNAGMKRSDMAFIHWKMLEIEPDYTLSRMELLPGLLEKEDREGVRKLCAEGRKYDPQQMAFYIYEALSLNELERPAEAIAVLEEGEEKLNDKADKVARSEMVALLGDLYHEQQQVDSAYSAYDRAIRYNSDNYLCLNNYAYFLSQEGIRLDKAAEMSKRTIEAEPENATYLDTYAWILFQQEQYTQAKIYIDQTIKLSEETPDNATLFDHAGDIYFRCGEVDMAVGYWKKALKLTGDKALQKTLKTKIRRRKL